MTEQSQVHTIDQITNRMKNEKKKTILPVNSPGLAAREGGAMAWRVVGCKWKAPQSKRHIIHSETNINDEVTQNLVQQFRFLEVVTMRITKPMYRQQTSIFSRIRATALLGCAKKKDYKQLTVGDGGRKRPTCWTGRWPELRVFASWPSPAPGFSLSCWSENARICYPEQQFQNHNMTQIVCIMNERMSECILYEECKGKI